MCGLGMFKTICSICLVVCLISEAASDMEGVSDKEILDSLLIFDRYDKRSRPPTGETIVVSVNILLVSLATPDESSLKYEVEFLLYQEWYDPRLKFGNMSLYTVLNAIHHRDDLWLPDTYFVMHGDDKEVDAPFALRIYQNGTVAYIIRKLLVLSCQAELHIFPFDHKLCIFSIESKTHVEGVLRYVWKNDVGHLDKSPTITTLNAYLRQNLTITCFRKPMWSRNPGNHSCLEVDLIFARDRPFYFTTVFIPGIILVTSSFITFWLEWNAVPARAMIGVTTMLNFFTTSNGFRTTLPVVSNLTAMNVWDGVSMCFIYASLLEFICVNYVGRKRPAYTSAQTLKDIGSEVHGKGDENQIFTIECTNSDLKPFKPSSNTPVGKKVKKKEPSHPIRVAKNIDVIARITFPVAYIAFLLFFFIHYKSFS